MVNIHMKQCIQTLLLKFPVRRKRLMEAESMEAIRRALEPIALISPHLTLTVLDVGRNVKLLSTRKVQNAPGRRRNV